MFSENEPDDLALVAEADYLAAVMSRFQVPPQVRGHLAELIYQLCLEVAREAQEAREPKAARFFRELARKSSDPDTLRQAWYALRTVKFTPDAFTLLHQSLLVLAGDRRSQLIGLHSESQRRQAEAQAANATES